MLNGRLYRAAFLPFVLALAVAAFALGGRPLPRTTTLAPDAFEGQRAFAETQSLAERYPERRPGGPGDNGLARYVAGVLRGLGGTAGGGFTVHVLHTSGQTIEGDRRLETVVAVRPGSTPAAPILIVAHRDAAGAGARAELSATASLLELARVFSNRETKRTIVLVSTSGGSGGDVGAQNLLAGLEAAGVHGPFDGAIVLGDLASSRMSKPIVVPYSDGLGSAPLTLSRTVSDAIKRETGWDPGAPSTFGQLAHLAFPLAAGEQGVLDAQGLPTVLVQASGERGPSTGERVEPARLEGLGRGVLSAVDALDTAPDVPTALQHGIVLGAQDDARVGAAAADRHAAAAAARRRGRRPGAAAPPPASRRLVDAVDARLRAAVPLLRGVLLAARTARHHRRRARRAGSRRRPGPRRRGDDRRSSPSGSRSCSRGCCSARCCAGSAPPSPCSGRTASPPGCRRCCCSRGSPSWFGSATPTPPCCSSSRSTRGC